MRPAEGARVRGSIRLGILLGLAMGVAVAPAQTPKPQDANRQAALALEQQGKNPEAEAAWRAYLQDHPSDPEPYAQLGLLEARQEHYQ
jgi:hypothetical protein